MKKPKKLIIIVGVILLISILVGIVLAKDNEKENKVIDSLEIDTDEKEETLNVILEDNEENETEEKQEDPEIKQENIIEEKQEEKVSEEKTANVNSNSNKQTSNDSGKTTSAKTSNTNQKVETKPEVQATPSEPVKVEQPQATTPKQEESKPVENKPVEKPVQTAPVRTYKKNQTYINKLRSTIVTEVTNNLDRLKKYGITDISQYRIIDDDSSICTYNGGNRSGWTYENISAYNTFKSSILKGTYLKIYAVDEYQNGEYIQTLCYYGH